MQCRASTVPKQAHTMELEFIHVVALIVCVHHSDGRLPKGSFPTRDTGVVPYSRGGTQVALYHYGLEGTEHLVQYIRQVTQT